VDFGSRRASGVVEEEVPDLIHANINAHKKKEESTLSLSERVVIVEEEAPLY